MSTGMAMVTTPIFNTDLVGTCSFDLVGQPCKRRYIQQPAGQMRNDTGKQYINLSKSEWDVIFDELILHPSTFSLSIPFRQQLPMDHFYRNRPGVICTTRPPWTALPANTLRARLKLIQNVIYWILLIDIIYYQSTMVSDAFHFFETVHSCSSRQGIWSAKHAAFRQISSILQMIFS